MGLRGRPKTDHPREKTIKIRMTQEEFDILRNKASKCKMTMSRYIRLLVLHRL